MYDTTSDAMDAVNSVLAREELTDEPRALLLLRLCQLLLSLSPDEAEHYWSQLVPLQYKIPKEFQEVLEDVRFALEPPYKSNGKGFAAEIIADVETARQLADSNDKEARQRLHNCATRLSQRRWPFGKTEAWIALVDAWDTIDRQQTLQLIDKIPNELQRRFIRRMHASKPLLIEEWEILADKVGIGQAVKISLEILDNDKTQLFLPKEILLNAGKEIIGSMHSRNEQKLADEFSRYAQLMRLCAGNDQADVIHSLFEEMYDFLVDTWSLNEIWPARFLLIAGLLELGVSVESLTADAMGQLRNKTPDHLQNFVRSHYAALTASTDNVQDVYTTLMSNTLDTHNAEAWFLVTILKCGLQSEALELAEKSARAGDLLPRLRRAWLCTQPETARSTISVEEIAGDPIGEFLIYGTTQDRVSYLKKVTNGGAISVPGVMWAGAGTDEESDGLRSLWKNLITSSQSIMEAIEEYVAHNLFNSSYYRKDIHKDRQFAEYVRMHGYSNYNYADIDNTLLTAFVAWGDEEPELVQSVVHAMWNAIKPDDQILKVEWLRNIILARCRNVFSADPKSLMQDYLSWFKKELVDKGRSWNEGNTEFKLKYEKTEPFRYCLAAAMAVNSLSSVRRDEILLSGLREFEGDSGTVEAAAVLYNSDKEVLAFNPPINIKPNLIEAWQRGVAKSMIIHMDIKPKASTGGV